MSQVRLAAEEREAGSSASVGVAERTVEALWRFWASPRLALGLILGIAGLCLVGVALPQAQAGLALERVGSAPWPGTVNLASSFVAGLVADLGLSDVGSSPALRLLLVALALNTLICTANRAPSILCAVLRPPITASRSIAASADLRKRLTLTASDPVGALANALRKRGYRVLLVADATGLYADRFRFGRLGTLVSHSAIILILVGALVGSVFGLRGPSLAMMVGEERNLWPGSDLSARVDRFVEERHPGGQIRSYVADVTVRDRGIEVARQNVRIGEPLRYGGIALNLGRPGPAVSLVVRDAVETMVYAETLALDDESSGQPGATLALDESDLLATISRKDGDGGGIHLDVYGLADSRLRGSAELSIGRSATVGGLTWLLADERPYATLQATRDPGAPLIWLAGTLLVVGMAAALYLPHRQVWISVTPVGRGSVVSSVRRRSRSEGSFVVVVVGRSRRDVGLVRDWSKIAEELALAACPEPTRRRDAIPDSSPVSIPDGED